MKLTGCLLYFQRSKTCSDDEEAEDNEAADEADDGEQKRVGGGGLTKKEQRAVNRLVQKQVQGSTAFRRQQSIKSAKEAKKNRFATKKRNKTKSKRDKHHNPMKNPSRK